MKARVGIYSVGLETYWSQFAGFFERVQFYNKFIAEKMSKTGAEVYNFGVVDSAVVTIRVNRSGVITFGSARAICSCIARPTQRALPSCPCIRFARQRRFY